MARVGARPRVEAGDGDGDRVRGDGPPGQGGVGGGAARADGDGGVDGLEPFCRRQYPRLVGMIGLYLGDRAAAEELAQEALIRLCRHWSDLPTEADAGRWLTRVAMNLAKSSVRTRAVRQRILDRHGPSLAARDHAPSERVADVVAVRAAVRGLPDRQRQVVILRFFNDLPVAEVAAVMKCPEGTVKSLTSQAITALRRAGLGIDDD